MRFKYKIKNKLLLSRKMSLFFYYIQKNKIVDQMYDRQHIRLEYVYSEANRF